MCVSCFGCRAALHHDDKQLLPSSYIITPTANLKLCNITDLLELDTITSFIWNVYHSVKTEKGNNKMFTVSKNARASELLQKHNTCWADDRCKHMKTGQLENTWKTALTSHAEERHGNRSFSSWLNPGSVIEVLSCPGTFQVMSQVVCSSWAHFWGWVWRSADARRTNSALSYRWRVLTQMSHRHDQIECVETHRIRGGACRDLNGVRIAEMPLIPRTGFAGLLTNGWANGCGLWPHRVEEQVWRWPAKLGEIFRPFYWGVRIIQCSRPVSLLWENVGFTEYTKEDEKCFNLIQLI